MTDCWNAEDDRSCRKDADGRMVAPAVEGMDLFKIAGYAAIFATRAGSLALFTRSPSRMSRVGEAQERGAKPVERNRGGY